MKLADLRKVAIRRQFRIRFRLQNGLECVVTEHGIAHVPGLKAKPDFSLEQQLEAAQEFLLEPAIRTDPKRPAKPQSLQREELAAMASSGTAAAGAHPAEHEDE
jgi:hypothetical protein